MDAVYVKPAAEAAENRQCCFKLRNTGSTGQKHLDFDR
jgi:hypothetical protein